MYYCSHLVFQLQLRTHSFTYKGEYGKFHFKGNNAIPTAYVFFTVCLVCNEEQQGVTQYFSPNSLCSGAAHGSSGLKCCLAEAVTICSGWQLFDASPHLNCSRKTCLMRSRFNTRKRKRTVSLQCWQMLTKIII